MEKLEKEKEKEKGIGIGAISLEAGIYDDISLETDEALRKMNLVWENKKSRPSVNPQKVEDRLFNILDNMKEIKSLHVEYFQNITNFVVYCNNDKYRKEVEFIHKVFSADFLTKGFDLLPEETLPSQENRIQREMETAFTFLLVLMNSVPFVLLKKESFKLAFVGRNYEGKRTKEIKNFSIKEMVQQGFLKEMLEDILIELMEKERRGIKVDYMEWVGVIVLLAKNYKNLNKEIKSYIMRFMPTFIAIDNSSLISLAPFTLDEEFWEDFMDYKVDDKESNKEKILNSRKYPLFRKWFVGFWKDQKEIPKAAKEVLIEIDKQNCKKAEQEKEAKDAAKKLKLATQKTANATREITAPKAKEKKVISAPEVEKVDKFKYKISRKEDFDIEMQVGKKNPEGIKEGKMDLEQFAHAKKMIVVKFRYKHPNNKPNESHETFEWTEIVLDKIPRKMEENNEKGDEKKDSGSLGKDISGDKKKKTKTVPETKVEKAAREKKELLKSLLDSLELFEEDKAGVFAGIPEKITEDSFSFKFSRDFEELVGQQDVGISVNIAEKTLEFKKLESNAESREILEKYVWDVLEEKIIDWEKRKKEKAEEVKKQEQKEEEKKKLEKLNKKQQEVNEWLEQLNKELETAKLFENSKNFAELLEFSKTSEGKNLTNISALNNYILGVGGETYIKKSREILNKMKKVGVSCNIKIKKKKVFIFGEVKISDKRRHKVEVSWNREKNEIEFEIEGDISSNSKTKIKKLFEKIFLKIFWEVLEESDLNTPFFAEFLSYKQQKEEKNLRKFLKVKEKNKDLVIKLMNLIKKIEKGDYLGRDEFGNIVKSNEMKNIGKDILSGKGGVKTIILRKDNIRSVDEGSNATQSMKFNQKSYEALWDFITETSSEKYLIKRFQKTVSNYNKHGENFAKYEINGKTPFRNKPIIDLLLDEILSLFEFKGLEGRKDFLSKNTEEINNLTNLDGKTLVELFLEKAKINEIPLTYVSSYEVKTSFINDLLNKYEKMKKN